MNDPFIALQELQEDLKEIEHLGSGLSYKLSLLPQQIRYIFSKIKSCETLQAAEYYFEILDQIQQCLAILAFKEELGMPDRLRKFVSDFDNFENVKEVYFMKIKNDEYTL